MKFQNSNLLMSVAGIDLTETEMEAIAGGVLLNNDYATFWQEYNISRNKQITLNKSELITKIKLEKIDDYQTDINNFQSWFNTLSDTDKRAIKKDKILKQAFNQFGVNETIKKQLKAIFV